VTPIDVATNTTGAEIKVGRPLGIAITPDGKTAYVTNLLGGSVTPIELATNKPGAEIKVGSNPRWVAIAPDGKTAYVANSGGSSVTPIDVATNTHGAEIKVGSFPEGVAITPDGKTAYVANVQSESVTPIDLATNKPGTEIKVGEGPIGVAIAPVQPTSLTAAPQLVLFPPPYGVGLFRVSATLTSGGSPLKGKPISFSVGKTSLCSAATASNGVASCKLSLKGEIAVLFANSYTSTFAGDNGYTGSKASTHAIVLGTGTHH
jgi:YVTN family beta-propeller protein